MQLDNNQIPIDICISEALFTEEKTQSKFGIPVSKVSMVEFIKARIDDGTIPVSGGGGGAVSSVNGQTGVVVLDKTSVGLSNVNNTSDLNKPISTATQTALDLKQTGIQFQEEGTPLGVLGNVEIVDFVGSGVTASRTGSKVTVTVTGSSVGAATTTSPGIVELATDAEAETGTDTTRVLTPSNGQAVYMKKSVIDAKGDLIVGTADNTSTRLAVGANGQALVADSTQATGVKWASISGNVPTYSATIIGANAATKCFIDASGTGVTLNKVNSKEWTFNVPAGVELYSIRLGLNAADNPGVTDNFAYFAFNYADAGTRPYNQNNTGLDARTPICRGINLLNGVSTPISRTNEQSYDLTTGATNLITRLSACSGGNCEIKIDSFTNMLSASNCQILMTF